MANYLEQIPKQLAARRKAFAAAKDNSALLPSCWAIVRSIANNMYDYARNSVIGGCTFPDRPMYLSVDDAAFLNFGATPTLLRLDAAWMRSEKDGTPPPDDGGSALPEEEAERVGRSLAILARCFGTDHHATRVYNFEAWLQDMYRDRLDVDFAEDLERQIDSLNAYMDGVPKSLAATGLSGPLAQGVMDAFRLFRTITGSSHQLDREKMSFTDRRSYVNTIQKIELIMTKADKKLGAASVGRSVVRELFGMWKDANYEMMALTRQLRALWAGTSLDDRIAELADLLSAVQKAMNRATEESRSPRPQLPVFRADSTQEDPICLEDVTWTFHAILLHDMVVGSNTILSTRETRKFGPLSAVLVPGEGQPRYCREIRKLGQNDEEEKRGKTKRDSGPEREVDVDRRIRYPLNCLVVPVGADRTSLLEDMTEAWLEFNQFAYGVPFKEYLESAKSVAPSAFLPPEGKELKDLPPTYARQALGGLTAAFVRWSRDGVEPDAEAVREFPAFRDMVLSRLPTADYLIPTRYKPFVHMFADAGERRKLEMWKRVLGPRFSLDRQLVAVNVLQKDWDAVKRGIQYLPRTMIKGNSTLDNAFAKARDTGDPFGEHKAVTLFRKYFTESPDLKTALLSVESQVAIEVETLRTQSESLGRVFQYDQASEAMLQRQASLIQGKRNEANRHIDLYLTGLMYAMDGNYEAAESALVMCLTPQDKRESDMSRLPPVPDVVGQEWFEEHLAPKDDKFSKRKVSGEDSHGTVCFEYVYYNLGVVYMKAKRYVEARMAFHGALELYRPEDSHLVRLWAEELREEAALKLRE